MKITKFTHSCLLVETEDRVVLFDPGEFSWNSKEFSMDTIERLDRVAITHQHGDHLSIPFLKAIFDKFPDAHLVANSDIQDIVEKEIAVTMRESTECTVAFDASHNSRIPWAPGVPRMTGFHFKDELTHPGDSFDFQETKRVLAMPMCGPWGSVGESLLAAVNLKPEVVLPIHDWHWNEEARAGSYRDAEKVLASAGIAFIPLENGVSVEV